MAFKYQSADHVFNIVNKKLHDNGTMIIDEIKSISDSSEEAHHQTQKYVNELTYTINYFWNIESDAQRKQQIKLFDVKSPLSTITWWATSKDYSDSIDYLLKLRDLKEKYSNFFKILDGMNDYLMFDLVDLDPEIRYSIMKYPTMTTEERIYSVLTRAVTDEFKKMIESLRGRHGVYFLYDQNEVLQYVGKSVNLGSRIISSINERKAIKVEYALTESKSDVGIYESYYIALLKPPLNVDGKHEDEVSIVLKDIRNHEIIPIYQRKELS